MARTKLTEIYKSLNEQSWMDDEDDMLGDFDAQLKKDMAKAGYGKRDTSKIFKRGDDAKFAKDDDKAPGQKKKTYGDLSPDEWDEIRSKQKTNKDYDPGNEPLEVQLHTGEFMFIDPKDIEAYVNGEDVTAIDPDRGGSEKSVNRENSDVVGVTEDELEDFLVSGDRSAKDVDDDDRFSGIEDLYGADLEEGTCTEQEIAEGTCGHASDGEVDIHNTNQMSPAEPVGGIHVISLQERFQKLANIKKKK